MVQTIGNPLSWGAQLLGGAGKRVGEVAEHLGTATKQRPEVQRLRMRDIRESLYLGWQDLLRFRSDVMAMVAIYPVIGFALAFLAFQQALLPLLFPLAAGIALLGPVAAIGLYEISRRHEKGEPAGWGDVLMGLRSRSVGPVIAMGVILFGIFIAWMTFAFAIHAATLGENTPTEVGAFFNAIFNTEAGRDMFAIGSVVGLAFAALVLMVAAFSFPMLIDRPIGVPRAVVTSIRVAQRNPEVVAAWGVCVALLLALGSLPLFLGLIIVLPWLGHATWHLYRKAIRYS